MIPEPDFTYGYYQKLLSKAMTIAPITPFRGQPEGPCIILRHDVDFDIFPAYAMAQIERTSEVNSTYFIMTTCHLYNPSSSGNREMLRSMSDDGQEIGLHFDPTVYAAEDENLLIEHVRDECRILERIVGQDINSISLHNPSVTGKYPLFEGYNNAYSPELFTDEFYISDSCMDFRQKDPMKFVEKAKTKSIQMVFHPLHWFDTKSNYLDLIYRSMRRHIEFTDKVFHINSTYIAHLGGRKLLDEIKRR